MGTLRQYMGTFVSAFLGAVLLTLAAPAMAVANEAAPMGEDPVVELRLREMAKELRCLVCQNQTLADSKAPLAEDFRREIRTLIKAGRSDMEITDFLVDRYGDFVRYRPPMKGSTALLWLGPALLVITGGVILWAAFRRRKKTPDIPLSEEARNRAESLLKRNDL